MFSRLTNQDLCVQVDETTDLQGWSMTAILIGALDGENLEHLHLIHMMDIVQNNNVTLQQVVIKSLHKVFGDDLDYDRVKLFLTDGAPYCLKAGQGLSALFPKMIHTTCIAHAMNRVTELVHVMYPKVNQLISETKKIFVKSGNRKREFAASCQIPLPPEPVVMH